MRLVVSTLLVAAFVTVGTAATVYGFVTPASFEIACSKDDYKGS